jgi:hypoxanthine phosphoribosyltransferase
VAVDPPVVLGWESVPSITARLAAEISADGLPDVIVGVLRGGMIPAVMLAHALAVRDVRAIEVTHTVADGVNAGKTAQPRYRNLASVGNIAGLDVLVADDIAGTGATAAVAGGLLRELGAARVRTTVWAVNEANWLAANYAEPAAALTYIGARFRGWVIFPWERS